MIEWSGGLKPSAVAGKLSVTRFTQRSCTGIKASGMPRRTVKKIETTSPMFEETVKAFDEIVRILLLKTY